MDSIVESVRAMVVFSNAMASRPAELGADFAHEARLQVADASYSGEDAGVWLSRALAACQADAARRVFADLEPAAAYQRQARHRARLVPGRHAGRGSQGRSEESPCPRKGA